MVNVTSRPLYPRERPSTHCIGGWVGLTAGLDGCGKSRPHGNSIPELYSVRIINFLKGKNNLNPLNPELNPICYLLALLAHHFLHVSRIRVKSLPLRLLVSYIYGAHILDDSRSHATTHHSRYDSCGRVISSSQRPLPNKTRHSQHTNIHAPGGI